MDQQIQQLQAQIDQLTATIRMVQARRINLNTDIFGMLETVSSVPSNTSRDLFDQVKIYSSGTTYRLYWYDYTNNAWRYASGT